MWKSFAPFRFDKIKPNNRQEEKTVKVFRFPLNAIGENQANLFSPKLIIRHQHRLVLAVLHISSIMMHDAKLNERSVTLRGDGNKFYNRRQFFDALMKYNESLCYAELGSENLGLAYANRSAVYFEMRLYEKCLSNVELAKQNNYPEMDFEVLEKRVEKCKDMMKYSRVEKTADPWNIFKLSHAPNPRVPFIVNCLEMSTNDKYGRHVISNRALKVGDVIAIEQPFCSVLIAKTKFHEKSESNIFQRCSNCLKENSMDLIPCETCCKGNQ